MTVHLLLTLRVLSCGGQRRARVFATMGSTARAFCPPYEKAFQLVREIQKSTASTSAAFMIESGNSASASRAIAP